MSNKIRLKRGSGSDPGASDLVVGEVALRTDNGTLFTKKDDGNIAEIGAAAGVSDGDKGDITVSNSGSTFTIDSGVVNNAKVASNAAIAGTKISPDFGSQDIATTGNINLPDSSSSSIGRIMLGDGTDMQLQHDGGGGFIGNFTGNLTVHSNALRFMNGAKTENFIKADANGAVELFHNNIKKLETTSSGAKVTGTLETTSGINAGNNISLPDNIKLKAGTGDDLQIYHDGSHSRIADTGTGFLVLQTSRLQVNNAASDEEMIRATENGSVELYHDGTKKFQTTSTGIDVIGNITVSGTVDGVDIAARNTLFGGLTSSSGVLSNGVTATTQSAGDNSTKVATTAYADTAVSNLVDSAPGTLNTLNELAAALGDDANFSTTVTNSIATKMPLAGGQFTGNITFSGSQTVDGRDLSVDGSKLDGIESGATADQTASEILTLIKTVDGAGSGLDADTLDGLNAAVYGNSARIVRTNSSGYIFANYFNTTPNDVSSGVTKVCVETGNDGYIRHGTAASIRTFINVENGATADQSASEILTLIKTVDGSGSGLDADLLDGANASVSASNSTIVQRHSSGYIFANYFNTTANDVTSGVTKVMVETNNDNYIRHGSAGAIRTFINVENGATADQSASEILNLLKTVDGSGSGLDADTLDGVSSGSFLRSDTGDTFSGDLTSSGSARILLKKDDNNVADHIQFYNGSTRVGEIGTSDSSWLRINQQTAKNIYTPRYIRADNGFFVDGTSKGINGSGNFIGGTIAGASDYGTLIRSNANDDVSGHTEWQDNYEVRLGGGANMRLYSNGTHSYIDNHINVLHLRCNHIKLQSISGENMLVGNANSSVELYRDNDRVFYTETRGVRFGDNTKIFENSSHNTAVLQHADIHHAIVFRGATNNNGSSITNENTTTFREYGKFVFRTGAINAPVRLTIAANGHIGAPSGSNIYPSSDVRLKKNVVNLDKGLDTIKSLRPVSFNWIDNYIEEEKDPLYGFIAQEVEAVDPNLTGLFAEEIKIGEDQENPDQVISDVKRVNEKFIIPILVKALQELTAKVETLEAG